MTDSGATYTVMVLGFQDAQVALEGLQRKFGLPAETARQVIARVPTSIKRNTSRESAQRYERALRRQLEWPSRLLLVGHVRLPNPALLQ